MMSRPRPTPLAAVMSGLLSGAAGIVAMDAVWYLRYRRGGGTDKPLQWEFSTGAQDWDAVSAPGQVGRRIAEGFLQAELPAERAGLTNDVMHWAYGLAWGGAYGVVAGSLPAPRIRWGLVFAPLVWASGYVVLPLAKLYKPIWEYDAPTLWKDLSAHLAYGVVTAASFRAVTRR